MFETCAFDPMDFDNGYDSFMPSYPTATQIHESVSNLDYNMDVSGFTMEDWQRYDPYHMDMRNPYINGYITDGSFDPLVDYDPYASSIIDNMKYVQNNMAISPIHENMFPNSVEDHTPVEVTDIFGRKQYCDPWQVDIMSGMNDLNINSAITEHVHNLNVASDNLISDRDNAVQNYHDAINRGDLDEALRWEDIANDKQKDLNSLLGVPSYPGVPVIASGL
jgi:hypothetical protein